MVPNLTVFVSSAAIMLVELVAGRLIAQYVGQSLYTWTGVIGMALAGISLGNYLGGRIADRSAGRRALGLLFLVGAAVQLGILPMNHIVGRLPFLIGLPWPVRILSHVALVFLPAFTCLGAISPVIARRALAICETAGRAMGNVYAWSIAGSIVGTFATGFFLMAWFSNPILVALSSAVLALAGLAYLIASRNEDTIPAARLDNTSGKTPSAWTLSEWLPHIATVFLASAAVMAVELVASRVLARSFGTSLYTWTTIIGVILAGLSLGGYAGGRVADYLNNRRLLVWLFVLSALLTLAVPLLDELLRRGTPFWTLAWPVQILGHCLLLFLALAFLLGMAPPVVARMALARKHAPGRTVGVVYAWGSAGSIFGTLITGYLLIDLFGTSGTLCLAAATLTALALAHAPKSLFVQGWAVVCAAAVASAAVPLAPFELVGYNLALRTWQGPDVVYSDESQYASIAVLAPFKERPHIREFKIDKLVHSKADLNNPADLKYEYEWFYSAVMDTVYPDSAPIRAMVIGGGGYAFPRYLELTRPGGYVEAIEIDPAVTEAAHIAFGLPRDTKVAIYNMDGRNRVEDLILQRERGEEVHPFDCVFGDSINDYSVPFHLTTREFTEKIDALLADDGLYLLNLIDTFESGRFLGAVVNTCKAVFPHVYVFSSLGTPTVRDTFVVVSSRTPRDLSAVPAHVRAKYTSTGSLLSEDDMATLAQRSRGLVLTDNYAPVDNLLAPVVRSSEVILLRRVLQADARLAAGHIDDTIDEMHRIIGQNPNVPDAYELLGIALRRKGQHLQSAKVLAKAKALAPTKDTIHNNLALAYFEGGELDKAEAAWREALRLSPDYATAHTGIAGVFFRQNRLDEAMEHLERAAEIEPGSATVHASLGAIHFRQGDTAAALASLHKAVEIDPANPALREQLAMAHWQMGAYDAAWKAVRAMREAGGEVDPQFLRDLQRDSGRGN